MTQTLKRRQLYRKRTKRSKCRTHKPISKKRCAAKKGCRRTKRSKHSRAYCRGSKNKRHPGRPRRRKTRRGGGCGCGGIQTGGLHPLFPASVTKGSPPMVNVFPQWSPGQRALGAS